MKSYVVERLCFLKTTFVSGKDALLRAGSGSWSSAKALLPVLLRGILSDFSSDNGVAPPPTCATAPRTARGIALHADIDGGSAVSSANRPRPRASPPPHCRRRRGASGARHFGPAYSQRLLSHSRLARAAGGGSGVARRAAGRQMNTQYTHALRFLANFL